MYRCALTGIESPNIVACMRTGILFDRDAIREYLRFNKFCPITNAEMDMRDFIEIKTDQTAHIPEKAVNVAESIQKLKQNWDSAQTELNSQKLQEDNLKKELLYIKQQNAQAKEYIAKLLAEKEALASHYVQLAEQVKTSEAYKQRMIHQESNRSS